MEIYLVGGAVRDRLLGFPCSERDWVVVGSTPAAMKAAGYKPVGKDFPVFIHPDSGDEYALARTERKTAPGYTGFQFHAEADVTLEEDLARRDLTINAIAEDSEGQLFDPYQGQRDIEQRLLRHVSPAFAEDPVRILRVARFAARYHHLGFRVADETLSLMRSMVDAGEVNHLVAERVWKELSRALTEANPEVFIEVLRSCGALAVIMPELDQLFGVEQRAEFHPEIDTGIHVLMALRQSVKLTDSTLVRFAVLVHDLGKGVTPKDLLPRHPEHEMRGLPLVKALCERLAVPNDFRKLALLVCEYHLLCHQALELKPKTVYKLLHALNLGRQKDSLENYILACEADARGRLGLEDRVYPQSDYLRLAGEAFVKVNARALIAQGHSGAKLGEELRLKRIAAIRALDREPFKQVLAS